MAKDLSQPLEAIKAVISCGLLIFSIVLIMGLIAKGETKISGDVSPALAYVTLWAAIIWLTMVEGGQGSLVGLTPVNLDLYKESHKLAYKSTVVCYEGDNLDRYLLGRQFMVVVVVFTVNMSGGPNEGAELWGLPGWVFDIFLGGGLAMILLTCNVGQLNSQVNASHCMLDYINNYFAYFTFCVAMLIEFSGLLHASYLIQFAVAAMSGKPIESNEEPREGLAKAFFWFRCLLSLAILGFCFAVTFEALFNEQTTLWGGVPPSVAVIVWVALMCVVGMLEGMQIAFFAMAKLPESERGDSYWAKKTCGLLFKGEGVNLPGFMIGRQLCVVSCMFFVARVTSVSLEDDEDNIFGVGDGLQELFNFGFLGALIVTIVASIAWQLVASAFPMLFLNSPFTYILLSLCLALEATGICNASWVLAAIHKKIAGFQRDEVYIGTAEERAKKNMGDDVSALPVGVGHMAKLPGFFEKVGLPPAILELMENDPSVKKFVDDLMDSMHSRHSAASAEVNSEVP